MKNCTTCGKELLKPLDEYGRTGEEKCFDCYFSAAEAPTAVDAEEIDIEALLLDDGLDDDDEDSEFIECDGMSFCFACGVLACHGNEEFDFCDHRTGFDCTFMEESVFAEDDEDDLYDEDDWQDYERDME